MTMGYDDRAGVLVAVILGIIIAAPYIPPYPNSGIVNPFECREVQGNVVEKIHDEEGHRIYVEISVNSLEGYKIWVSNATYHAYEIGDSYSQVICDIVEWEEMLEQFEELKNVGILIPTT